MDHKAFFYQGISLKLDQIPAPDEVSIRNAIGRMYYYAYHEALIFVQNHSFLSSIYNDQLFIKKNPRLHKRLVKTFAEYAANTQDLKYGTISRYLGSLHTMRCFADYNLIRLVKESDFFSFLANLESLKLEIIKIDSNSYDVDIKIKSENIIQTNTEIGKVVVKKKGLRLLD